MSQPVGANVDEVVRLSPPSDAISGGYLEAPSVGAQALPRTIEVSGWVTGTSSAVRHIELSHGDRVLRQVPVDVPRPDVAGQQAGDGGQRAGYWTLLGLVGMPIQFGVDLTAVLADSARTRVPLGRIRGHREPLSASVSPKLQPILVTSLGRMGTTWMMRILGSHPSVVAHDRHPHEMRAARYWMHMFQVLSEPANEHQSAERDSFARNTWEVGHNPMFGEYLQAEPELLAWLGGAYSESLARFCTDSIDRFYERVARGRPGVTRFAEKSIPDQLPDIAADLYAGGREIFLVRDIRDTMCSIIAFNQKRGYQAFGREMWGSDLAYMEQLGRTYSRLARAWRVRAEKSTLVRYEDLVDHPEEVVWGLLNNLGLDAGRDALSTVIAAASGDGADNLHHQTSIDLKASVGRWRTDLPGECRDAVEQHFGVSLRAFGYSMD